MNISYNWLKEYVNFDLTPDEVAAALTSIGLETGDVEEVQSIKGILLLAFLLAICCGSGLYAQNVSCKSYFEVVETISVPTFSISA
jgi:hypothetical protein